MGFRNGAYARVWEVEDRGKFISTQLSVSKKDKNTGEYKTEFSRKGVRFIGDAKNILEQMGEPPFTVKLTSVDVQNVYDKEKEREYVNFVVFSAEPAESLSAKPQANAEAFSEDDEDMPF